MSRKRLKKHKQRSMNKRLAPCKKQMSDEMKAERKKRSEIDRIRTKASLDKKKKASK